MNLQADEISVARRRADFRPWLIIRTKAKRGQIGHVSRYCPQENVLATATCDRRNHQHLIAFLERVFLVA